MTARQIRKYANRRLYDTGASCYVKNDDLRRLLADGEPFSVVDAKSGRDITRSVLLGILAEDALDEQQTPIFSQAVLAQALQFDDDYLAGLFCRYLEKSMDVFLAHQSVFRQQMRDFDAEDPYSTIEKLAERQSEMLDEMARSFSRPSE